jgi:Family of unknown function (DUF6011)
MSITETIDPRTVAAVLGRLVEHNERTARPMAARLAEVKADRVRRPQAEVTVDQPRGAAMTDLTREHVERLLGWLTERDADQAAPIRQWFVERADSPEGLSQRSASMLIDQLKARLDRTPRRPAARQFDDFADVIDGNYAIMRDADSDHVDFYRVSRSESKRQPGRVWIKVQERAGGDLYPIEPYARQFAILRDIRAAGPQAAAELYADKERRCYVCNTGLTDPTSRADLIGPECKRKGRGF